MNFVELLVSEIALEVIFSSSILFLFLISVYLCYITFSEHLNVGKLPGLQVCCLRVVAIAPAYALLAWLKLLFLPALVVWKTAQDLCEAYAIYCYWVMLILWCGGQRHTIEELDKQDRQTCSLCPMLGLYGKYSCPLIVFQSSHSRFIFWRIAMTQLIVVKLVMNLLNMLLMLFGFHGLGKLHFVVLVSTGFAMHSLLETYSALKSNLHNFSAEKKFICIKILIGIALLQPLLTNALETVGAFPDDVLYGYNSRKWSQRVLGTISVIQMVIFSLLLSFAFSLKFSLRDASEGDNVESDQLLLSSSGRLSERSFSSRSEIFSPRSGRNDRMDRNVRITAYQMMRIWDVLLCKSVDESFITYKSNASLVV